MTLGLNADTSRTPDHDYDAPKPGTCTLPVIKPAADGALLDAAGNIRNIYSSGTLDPRLVLADIRTLMLEENKK